MDNVLKILGDQKAYSDAEIREAKIELRNILRKEVVKETFYSEGGEFDPGYSSERCPNCMKTLKAYGRNALSLETPRCWFCGQRIRWKGQTDHDE